jgi:amino acid transporter
MAEFNQLPAMETPKKRAWLKILLGVIFCIALLPLGILLFLKVFPANDPYSAFQNIITDHDKIEKQLATLTDVEHNGDKWIPKHSFNERQLASSQIIAMGYTISKNRDGNLEIRTPHNEILATQDPDGSWTHAFFPRNID